MSQSSVPLRHVEHGLIDKPTVEKSMANVMIESSIPTGPTNENRSFELISDIFLTQKKWATKTVTVTRERYPFKPARLVHYNHDLTKRWHVVFWAWDINSETMIRKRLFEPLNRRKYNTVTKRLEVADEMIFTINRELRAGKVLGKERMSKPQFAIRRMKLIEAIRFVQDQKAKTEHRKSYVRGFNALIFNFNQWLEYNKRPEFLFTDLSEDDCFDFFDFLKAKGLSNKSHNGYKIMLTTVLNFLWKRDRKLFKSSPIAFIDKLPTASRKHVSFSAEQIKEYKKICLKHNWHSLLLFAQTIYYTMARPRTEVLQLKVQDVDLKQSRIFFRWNAAKTRTDDYVIIPNSFKTILKRSGALNQSPESFLIMTHDPKKHYKKHIKIMKEMNLLGKGYTMYSFKHSGAINFYMKTKDIKLLQRQMRHKSSDMTNVYLRDLGIMDESIGLKEWKGAF